jgi:hypothetical protein
MNGQRTASFVGAIIASALLSASALASTGLTPRAERALGARYEGMADYYAKARREAISSRSGTGLSARAEKAWGARYVAMAEYYRKDVGTSSGRESRLSPQALEALGARWEATAAYYRQVELEQARRRAAAFDWLDAGIGALVATGTVALLGLGALGLAYARRPARPAVR